MVHFAFVLVTLQFVVFQGVNIIGNELKNAAPAKMKQLAKEINECIESIWSYIQIDQQEMLLIFQVFGNFNNLNSHC